MAVTYQQSILDLPDKNPNILKALKLAGLDLSDGKIYRRDAIAARAKDEGVVLLHK